MISFSGGPPHGVVSLDNCRPVLFSLSCVQDNVEFKIYVLHVGIEHKFDHLNLNIWRSSKLTLNVLLAEV